MKAWIARALTVGVIAALAACSNPRQDACNWHNEAKGVQTTWEANANAERGGRCKLVKGKIPLHRKDRCTQVLRARDELGVYSPPLKRGQAEFYCYGIKGA